MCACVHARVFETETLVCVDCDVRVCVFACVWGESIDTLLFLLGSSSLSCRYNPSVIPQRVELAG